jgi:uncharacterized protein (TIGR03086 family)
MMDLEPATSALRELIGRISDEQLKLPTPCEKSTVGDLLDHVDGLSMAFTAAANKTRLPGDQAPSPDGSRLGDDWRERIPQRLAGLATAWHKPDAWTGVTEAGGQSLPGEVAGVVALNEVLVHTWDLAVATGKPFAPDPAQADAALVFVAPIAEANPSGTLGLFGPALPVPSGATSVDRLICLTGRDPGWTAPKT